MKLTSEEVLATANPVMPVIAMPALEHALPLAQALLEGGGN